MGSSIWPGSAKAAISFTIDNLGEAEEINSGRWLPDKPVGQHHSVTEKLPRMLQILDETQVPATFFFETWSSNIYPEAVKDVVRRGHELAWHGYQHEKWGKLSEQKEEELFEKSFHQAGLLGLKYKGFRPPGGLINNTTYGLLHKYGVRYVSPAAKRASIVQDIAILPFQWESIDALYYMPSFSGLRQLYGYPAESLDPNFLKKRFLQQVEAAVESNGYISFLFHSFLQTSEERFAVMKDIIETISRDPRIWCAPCNQVADWVFKHPDSFKSDPGWITDSW